MSNHVSTRRRTPALIAAVAMAATVLPLPAATAQVDGFLSITPGEVLPDQLTTTTFTASTDEAGVDLQDADLSVEILPPGFADPFPASDVTVTAADTFTFRAPENRGSGTYFVEARSVDLDLFGTFEVTFEPSVCAEAAPLAQTSTGLDIGFEDGFDAWTEGTVTDEIAVVGTETFGGDEGDAETAPVTTVSPFEGEQMARLGATYDSDVPNQPLGPNEICQDFVVDSTTERFAFNIFTYDYTGFDEFRYEVTVQDPSSGAVVARYRQGAFGAGGDTTLKSTGWRGVELDLTGRLGQTLRMTISAGGTQDPLFGFWAYVDSAEDSFPEFVLPPAPTVSGAGSAMTDPVTGLTTIAFPAFTEDFGDLTLSYPVGCAEGVEVDAAAFLFFPPVGSAVPFPAEVTGSLATVTLTAEEVAQVATANSTIAVQVECADGSQQVITIGSIVLYDPSGFLTDAITGEPIEGAEVRLFNVPGWSPRTGPDDDAPDTCESNLSKPEDQAWSQPAPTDVGQLEAASSPRISPNVNPFISNEDGYYGWDVAEGCWYVTVTAEGYQPLVSPVVGVPPEVTDLDLEVEPIDETPPAWPEDAALSATATSPTTVELTWPAATDRSEPITYLVSVNGGAAIETTATSRTVTSLQPDTQQAFEVKASDAFDNVGEALTASVRTPPAPGPVIAPPTCEGVARTSFPDVPAGFTHADAIGCAATLGIIAGRTDGTFAPSSTLTRGQLASLLDRALRESGVELTASSSRFTDIAGNTHEQAIRRLSAAGIIAGRTETTFEPQSSVTRGQLMSLLDRASRELMVAYPAVSGPRFGDIAGSPHEGPIDRLNAAGIAQGYGDGRFGPSDTVRRGQAASFLVRWLEDQAERLS